MKNSLRPPGPLKGKTIVISGINLYQAGPLSVYFDFLNVLKETGILEDNHVTVFVHRKELFDKYEALLEIRELPRSRDSYLYRLYYEWIYFFNYSKKRKVDYWISLHDITPIVQAEYLCTYCHNPSPFYKPGRLDWKFSKKICLFAYFYKFLYGINIKKNDYVIVQQNWIRDAFKEKYKINNIIVANPENKWNFHSHKSRDAKNKSREYRFIYAAFPRVFKNFEVICEACRHLEDHLNYRVILTIDGNENQYSAWLKKTYGNNRHIQWIGLQEREHLFKWYMKTDCMIFPSKLETWGLPISEYMQTGKPILLADLPYAHEAANNYDRIGFFNVNHSPELAEKMRRAIKGEPVFGRYADINIPEPFAKDWYELCDMLFH